jgi:hypothetical protein
VVSVDHESQRGENRQRDEKPPKVAGKIGRGFKGHPESIAKTQIGRCPDHAPR